MNELFFHECRAAGLVFKTSEDWFKWQPAFFVRDRGEEAIYRYKVLLIEKGKVGDFTSCIQFEGHENIAFTDYDIENLPF